MFLIIALIIIVLLIVLMNPLFESTPNPESGEDYWKQYAIDIQAEFDAVAKGSSR